MTSFAATSELIEKQLAENPALPSMAVAVARDGEILWEHAAGLADKERGLPATPGTPYSIASVTKPFTTTALMVLVERGLVDLDRPANDYLGEAKLTARLGRVEDATVRRLADHTSGLPWHVEFFFEDEPYRRPPMEETIGRYGVLVTPPGERHHYSNLGYGILDHIVARVGEASFADFLRDEVLLPLGMTRSSVDVAPDLQELAAKRYAPDGTPYPGYDFVHPGASAVYASVHDLVRFGAFHIGARLPDQKEILSDDARLAMQQSEQREGPAAYGLGWSVMELHGYPVVSHSGAMCGVSSVLMSFPDERLVVALATNAKAFELYAVLDSVLSATLPEFPARRDAAGGMFPMPPPPAPFVPTPAQAGRWVGAAETYEGLVPVELEVQESGTVTARVGDNPSADVELFGADAAKGTLVGLADGEVPTSDARREPHRLAFDLTWRGDVLTGVLCSASQPNEPQGSTPGSRGENMVAYWCELRRP